MMSVLSWSLTLGILLLICHIVRQVINNLTARNTPPVPTPIAVKTNPTPPSGVSKTAKKNAKRKAKELANSPPTKKTSLPNDEKDVPQPPKAVPPPAAQHSELTKSQLQKLKDTNRKLLDTYRSHLNTLQTMREAKTRRTLTGNRFATAKDILDVEDLEGYISEDELADVPIHEVADVLREHIQELTDAIFLEKESSNPNEPRLPQASPATVKSSPKKKKITSLKQTIEADDAELDHGWQVVPNTKKAPKNIGGATPFATSRVDPDQFEYAPTASTLAAQEAARSSSALPVGLTLEDAYIWKTESTPNTIIGGKKSNKRRSKKPKQYIPGLSA